MSEEQVLICQTTCVTIARIDDKMNAFTVSIVKFNSLPKSMVLVPQFDCEVLPLALGVRPASEKVSEGVELCDVRGKGWLGFMEGLEGVEVVGQPVHRPDWVFVRSKKTGALGIMRIMQR